MPVIIYGVIIPYFPNSGLIFPKIPPSIISQNLLLNYN
jgi:hypothetical protein